MVTADRAWVQAHLGSTVPGFCQRWRDSSSLAPGIPFKRLQVGTEALGYLQGEALGRVELGLNAIQGQTGDGAGGAFRLDTQGEAADTAPLWLPAGQAAALLHRLGEHLHLRGEVPGWRGELQTVRSASGQALFDLERGLFKLLGLRSEAVHVHMETPEGLIWIGRRAWSKKDNPGMLDNLSAGGVGAGETADTCVWRELDEEAGLTPADVQLEYLPQTLLMCRPVGLGWHHEVVHLFKGVVRRGWTPYNRDGEVQGFELMTRQACLEAVNRWQFTPDAGLVTALLLTGHTTT